jgi:hypothetical protein
MDPEPGSGAFLTPRSGSQTHISESLVTNFLGKKFFNSWSIGSNFSVPVQKNKMVYNFVTFMDRKKVRRQIFPLLFCCMLHVALIKI